MLKFNSHVFFNNSCRATRRVELRSVVAIYLRAKMGFIFVPLALTDTLVGETSSVAVKYNTKTTFIAMVKANKSQVSCAVYSTC